MVNSALLTVVKIVASVSSMVLCLSPAPSTYTIHKQQKTGDVEFLPLVTFLLFCHEWLLYGYVTHDVFPLFSTFIFGDLMCFVYLGVFVRYTKHRRYAVLVLVPALLAVVITTVYAVLGKTGRINQSESVVEDMVGWFTATASVLLYISPLATVRRVLQTKNSASIPLALCFAGLMENLFWLLYGLLKKDVFMWPITASCALFPSGSVLRLPSYKGPRPARGYRSCQAQHALELQCGRLHAAKQPQERPKALGTVSSVIHRSKRKRLELL